MDAIKPRNAGSVASAVRRNRAISGPPVDLEDIARQLRRRVVRMHHRAKVGHLGSSLSCVDILASLYFGGVLRIDPKRPDDPDRDRLILSKGHAASALYACLATRGFFPAELLDTFAQDGSTLSEHPSIGLEGIEFAGGSLAHGLSVGAGMAWAARLQGRKYRTFVVVGDGETDEGSLWEAASFAAAERLNRLGVIVDANGLQGIGTTRDTVDTLIAKFKAFGWWAVGINGHSHLMCRMIDLVGSYMQPTVFVAKTVKGRGISLIEDTVLSHYKILSDAELENAMEEIGA